MECLHCGKKISALRKLQDEEFCSAAHRKAYKKKQEELAVDFLRQSKPRRAKPDLSQPAPQRTASASPRPILVQADFRLELVMPQCRSDALRSNAQPVPSLWHAMLLAAARLSAPALLPSAAVRLALRVTPTPSHARSLLIKPVVFAVERPVLREWAAQPIWIEVAKQAPSRRPAAGFASVRPAWARAGRQSPSLPVLRVSSIPALRHPGVRLGAVRLSLASTARAAMRTVTLPASAQENSPSPWQSTRSPLGMPAAAVPPGIVGITGCARRATGMPCVRILAAPASMDTRSVWRAPAEVLHRPNVALAPRAPGLAVCHWMPALAPRASGRRLAPSTSSTRRCLVSPPEPPQIRSWRFDFPAPALGLGRLVGLKAPSPRPAPAPVRNTAAAFIWKFRVRLGPHARVIPVRPRFEDPFPLAPSHRVEAEPTADLWKKLTARWSAVPLRARQVAALLALAALVFAGFGYFRSSPSMQKANTELMASIQRRAAIDIQDDFRAGLSQWTGSPGWANTWTYDATGFARPGRLALLSGSAPLSDYRLEFLAEIDKKAVAWVFRAADARNYYACKLVESKRDPGAAFSIVRYAVIDGRERLRIQLPLPITATAKSLFRVRQEIRGDQFTTYLDGRVVDTWSDTSLARGGFGFFADPGETAYIRWVDVAYQDDALGRICAYLAPGKHD